MNEAMLLWINQSWQAPWLDVLFTWLSDKETFSFPLILLMVVIFGLRWGKTGWLLGVLMILVASTGDLLGSYLKSVFAEPRPCLNYWEFIRMPHAETTQCLTSQSGMPSNHALNFFATFSFLSFFIQRIKFILFSITICFSVAISRIYLGEHFPSQVLAGSVIGLMYGLTVAFAFSQMLPRFLSRISRFE